MKINFHHISLIFALIFLAIFSYVFYFLYREIEENNALAEASQIKWQEEAGHEEEVKMLDRGLKMASGEKEELEKHFVKNSDIVPFLNNMEELATKVGATAETTSVDLSGDKTYLLVELKALGNFQAIYKFLKLLENSPYEIEFSSLEITKEGAGEGAQSSTWQARFSIKLLSFKN